MSGGSDVDFMIHGIFQYSFFGHEVWITTTHVSILMVMLLLLGFAIAANRAMARAKEIPGGFQNVVEMIVEKLDGVVDGPLGKSAPKFYNYIGTIFVFILISNFSGLLGLRPPTADYGVTLPLGLLSFIIIRYNQFKSQSLKEIWDGMCYPLPPWFPLWFPINLIGIIAVPMSLSLRLFANILSGTVMMALVYGLLSQRASNMHTTFLYKLLGEEFQEKVLSPLVLSFQRSIQKVGQILEEIDASTSPKQKVFLEPEAHIVSLHRQASLLASQSFQLSLDTETANTLMEYLLDKQARINSGRLLSHISRAFLNVNLEVDHLDPYVRSRLEGSMAIYTETMGESLKNSIADLEMGLQDALESKQRAQGNLWHDQTTSPTADRRALQSQWRVCQGVKHTTSPGTSATN